MKIMKVAAAILLLWGGVLLPARAQPPEFPRIVIDPSGASVTIPARPAGVGVAGGDPVAAWALPASDWRAIDPFAGPVDWEQIGLLIVPELAAITYPALIESADAAGVPVFRTTPITSLDQWRAAARAIGAASGRDDAVHNLMLQLDRRQAAVRPWVGDRPPVRVLVLTPEGYTFGQGAWITDLISAAGGVNVAAEAGFADYRQIDDAAIRALAPDMILLSPAWNREGQIGAGFPAVRVVRLPFSPTVARDPGAELTILAVMLHPAVLWNWLN